MSPQTRPLVLVTDQPTDLTDHKAVAGIADQQPAGEEEKERIIVLVCCALKQIDSFVGGSGDHSISYSSEAAYF